MTFSEVVKPLSPIDTQSVKTACCGGKNIEIDGSKKINGRKQLITDTNGLLFSVFIHAANQYDGNMAFDVIKALKYRFERMKKIDIFGK